MPVALHRGCRALVAVAVGLACAAADARLRFVLEAHPVAYDVNTIPADDDAAPRYCPEEDDPCAFAARPGLSLVLVADAGDPESVSGEAHVEVGLSGAARLAEAARSRDLELRRGSASEARLSSVDVDRGGVAGDRHVSFVLEVENLAVGDRIRIALPRLQGVREVAASGGFVDATVKVTRLSTPAGEVSVAAGGETVTVLSTARAIAVSLARTQGAVLVDVADRRLLADSERQRLPDGEQRVELARADIVTVPGLLQWDGTAADDAWSDVRLSATGSRGLLAPGDRMFVDYDGDGTADASETLAVADGTHSLRLRLDTTDGGRTTYGWGVHYEPGGEEEFEFGATITIRLEVRYPGLVAAEHLRDAVTTAFLFEGVTREARAYAVPTTADPAGDLAHVRVTCESSQPCLAFLECFTDEGDRYFGEIEPAIRGRSTRVLDSPAVESTVGLAPDGPGDLSCMVRADHDITSQVLVRSGSTGVWANLTYVSAGGQSDREQR